MKKIASLVALAVASILVLSGCAGFSTQPDMQAVQYSGGLSSATFVGCIKPSDKGYTFQDNYYYYPAGQRTYSFADGGEAKPMTVVTRDNVTMTLPGIISFNLNSDCEMLRKFHETIGIKYGAYFDDNQGTNGSDTGWVQMLNDYVGKQIDRAADAAAKKYAWRDLYTSPTVKAEFEKEVAANIPTFVKQFAGGDFFVGWSVVLNALQPPDEIVAALNEEQASIAKANAAKQAADSQVAVEKAKTLAAAEQAKAIQALIDVLGVQGYIQFKAIEEGKVSVLPIPAGSDVIVSPK